MNSNWYILDDDNNPVESNMVEQAVWISKNPHRKIVAKTDYFSIPISTVFLGLDHRYGNGPPILFETMVFNYVEDFMTRYETYDQSLKGHTQKVNHVKQLFQKSIRQTFWDTVFNQSNKR